MRRLGVLVLAIAAFVGVAACGGRAGAAGRVDCGRSDLARSNYDGTATDCFWQAYSAGKAVVWRVAQVTVEGDPIPGTLTFDPAAGFEVVRDISADKFRGSGQPDLLRWKCATVAKHPWATDPSRFSFEFSGCSGPSDRTGFP